MHDIHARLIQATVDALATQIAAQAPGDDSAMMTELMKENLVIARGLPNQLAKAT